MSTWIDGVYAHSAKLRKVKQELDELSVAFSITGNDAVSTRLYRLSGELEVQAKEICRLTADKVDSDLKESMKMSRDILASMLAKETVDESQSAGFNAGERKEDGLR